MKKSLGWAYLFFALSLFGLAGLHTIYLGKPLKGVFFLLATWAGLWALTQVLILPSPSIPIGHWTGIAEAVAESCVHHPLAKPAPGESGCWPCPLVGVWWWVDLFSLPRQTRKANEQSKRTLR